MKTIIIFMLFLSMQLFAYAIDSIPRSFTYKSELKPLTKENLLDFRILKGFNNDSLKNEESKLKIKFPNLPDLYGVEEKVNFTPSNSGTWDTLDNGDKIWRLKIKSPSATSINIVIRNIYFENKSNMFIYSYDKTDILQPFTWKNNNKKKIISTDLIKGDGVIIEYFEPKEIQKQPNFQITKIIHGFEDLISYEEKLFNQKNNKIQLGDCHRDVNCPEGEDWCREKNSVAILLAPDYYPYWGYCTGSLLNNVKNDYTPYFLTAFHCLDHNSNGSLSIEEKDNVEEWSFKFGYIREGCDFGSTLSTKVYSGAEFKAAYVYSDFALLELLEQPESGVNNFPDVYFNGWNRTGSTPNWVVGIHHPDRAVMKISVSDESPDIVDYSTHWFVDWTTGTTEGGSSGSPLYDPNHRVIGQDHYGNGLAPCNPNKKTGYGRFSVSWGLNRDNDEGLHHWLDPDGTGVQVLDGIHMPNNQYGHTYVIGSFNRNAYDDLRVGGGVHNEITSPFRVNDGVTMDLKAGREIRIRPCTQIVAGSEFHAYIEELDCDDVVALSDPDDIYSSSCGGNSLMQQSKDVTETERINFKGYELSHNIPNPFSRTTEIIYYLPKPGKVVVQVYNSMGMPVAELVNIQSQNAGEHKVTFDAKNLPDGVYFYTLRTPEFTETKQMILIK